MNLEGHVQNGVVVLDGGVSLPEGARVVVSQLSVEKSPKAAGGKKVELPLVTAGAPGSIALTNERIHEILEEEDIAALKKVWDAPS